MTDKKSYGLSRNWEVIKLSEEIQRYVLNRDDCARVELLNQIIDGKDLAEALGYLKLEIAKTYNKKLKKKEDKQIDELLNNLEGIIKGKEGTIVNDEYQLGTTYNQGS